MPPKARPPELHLIRTLLSAVLPTDEDFEALCGDFFSATAKRFASGMDRVAKTNLLLKLEHPPAILTALETHAPERFAEHRRLMQSGSAKVTGRKPKRPLRSPRVTAELASPTPMIPTEAAAPSEAMALVARADVVIVTALKEEYDEARKVDDGALDDWTEDCELIDREVAFRTFQTASGQPLRIALTWAPRMRATSTADTAGRLLDKLGAKCVAMCGVCAGRRGKVQPGDVIIGDLLYTYDAGSMQTEYDEDGTKHERFQSDPDPVPLNDAWRHRAQAFKPPSNATWILNRPATLAAQGDWILARLHASDDPQTHAESKQRCPAWKEALHRLQELGYVTISKQAKVSLRREGKSYISRVLLEHRGTLPEPPPWTLHIAPIATGGNVMRDPKLFERLSSSMRKVLGVEMEAAAIASVAHARSLPWLVMKGVMDHADHDKDDLLKSFAARASAECLILFLRQNLVPTVPAEAVPQRPSTSVAVRTHRDVTKTDSSAARKAAPTRPLRSPALDELKKKVQDVLRREPALLTALVELGYVPVAASEGNPVSAVTDVLTERAAKDVVTSIAGLARKPSLLASARELLWHILPLAGDWESVLAQAQGAGTAHDALELPLRTTTLAEVMMARLDVRSCLFAPGDAFPQGTGHVPMPSVAYAPLFDLEGRGLAQAVLFNLWKDRRPTDPLLPGKHIWDSIKRECANEREFMSAAKAEISAGAQLDPRRYLLFIDAMLGPEVKDLDASWTIAQKALGAALPGLRLVRLKGRQEALDKESEMIPFIRQVRDLS